MDEAYYTVVRWKKYLFRVPFSKTGKVFASELSRLFRDCADGSVLEAVALKAVMIMPSLLLQCPHCQSKHKESMGCLERRLSLWADGNILELLLEGQSIQD